MRQLDMKEVQSCALDILVKIAEICESQNIRYSLAYGTLIGAIRHNGFIPWDDDIDLFMPRPDYEAFLDYLKVHPAEDLKVFNTETNKNYPFAITRISDMRYIIEESKYKNCGMGIFVDIYPIDGLGNSTEDAIQIYEQTRSLKDEMIYIATETHLPHRFLFTSPYKYIRHVYSKVRGSNYLLKKIENIVLRYNYNSCKYVGVPLWTWNNAIYKRAWFEEFINVPFEGYEFKSIKCYDEFLRLTYGDYMQLPPIEERIYHHAYKAYIR